MKYTKINLAPVPPQVVARVIIANTFVFDLKNVFVSMKLNVFVLSAAASCGSQGGRGSGKSWREG